MYKNFGKIRFGKSNVEINQMERINISKEKNFIGSWNINDDNLCNNIVKFFEIIKYFKKKAQL